MFTIIPLILIVALIYEVVSLDINKVSQTLSGSSGRFKNVTGLCSLVVVAVDVTNDSSGSKMLDSNQESDNFYLECMNSLGVSYKIVDLSSTFIAHHFIYGPFISGDTTLNLGEYAILDTEKIEIKLNYQGGVGNGEPSITDMTMINKNTGSIRPVVGIRTVLVVRIIAKDESTTLSDKELGDSVFGTSGDPVNLISTYGACSHGKLNFKPTGNRSGIDTNIINGVVSISVDKSTEEGHSVMRNAVTNELHRQFQDTVDSLADHVIYCLPPNTMTWARAYAFINQWLSVYNDEWCSYASTQVHEIGHNLNLGHSGFGNGDLNKYNDKSGMMGQSEAADDSPQRCFNAAKLWQLGWFMPRSIEIDKFQMSTFKGEIADISQDPDDTSGSPIIIKINTPSSNDYFISFNRAIGPNIETIDGANQVRIVRTDGGSGENYSQSWLTASLMSGESWISDRDLHDGQTVTVKVTSITSVANIDIELSDVTNSPTPVPTITPTSTPTIYDTNINTDSPSVNEVSVQNCVDSDLSFYVNHKRRDCNWVTKNSLQVTKRCQKANNAVKTHCPKACSVCETSGCVDSKVRFEVQSNSGSTFRSCEWVRRKNTTSRCRKAGVANTCRSACSAESCIRI